VQNPDNVVSAGDAHQVTFQPPGSSENTIRWLHKLAQEMSVNSTLARRVRRKCASKLNGKELKGSSGESEPGTILVSGDVSFGTMQVELEDEQAQILEHLEQLGLDDDHKHSADDDVCDEGHQNETKEKGAQKDNKERDIRVSNCTKFPCKVAAFIVPRTNGLQFEISPEGGENCLESGKELRVRVTCRRSKSPGTFATWVMFVIETPQIIYLDRAVKGERFVCVRRLVVDNVYDEHVHKLDPEAASFYPLKLRQTFNRPIQIFLEGLKPPVPPTLHPAVNLPSWVLQAIENRLKRDPKLLQYHTMCFANPKSEDDREQYLRYVEALVQSVTPAGRGLVETHSTVKKKACDLESKQVLKHLHRMAVLLTLEELAMILELSEYDLFYRKLSKKPSPYPEKNDIFYVLEAPGVGEGRPAVSVGDIIRVRPSKQPRNPTTSFEIRAYIHRVNEKSVEIRIPKRIFTAVTSFLMIKELEDVRWHGRFVLNQHPFEVMHAALNVMSSNAGLATRLLFPSAELSSNESEDKPPSKKVDKGVADLNMMQRSAVARVRRLRGCENGPFIIFGPPGTGKTTTVVEAMLSVLRNNKQKGQRGVRILACTPSDYSADILVSRLSREINESKDMLRLNRPTRHQAMESVVTKFCEIDVLGSYRTPELNKLLAYRVIVTTCLTSWRLRQAGVPTGHFTHMFFDESSQAMEPEMIVPLCLAGADTSVVLAGDHQQLGAVVHSPSAAKAGLRISLQERLLKLGAQHRQRKVCPDGNMAVRPTKGPIMEQSPMVAHLIDNYRSHPAILSCFSKLFYAGNLQAKADKKVTHSLASWEVLPQKDFPCLFYGVVSKDSFNSESGSLCNKGEADTIAYLIHQLLFMSRLKNLRIQDIGVIAPFRNQVLLIRKVLRKKQLGAINVGSVDDFQGKEMKVIFISTVLSKDREVLKRMEDSTNGIGIFSNPKRFNVAISRAKSLMVVVGNPFVLAKKAWWKNILKYCVTKGAYVGVDRAGEFLDIVQSSYLNLGSGENIEESFTRANNLYYSAERQWRIMA